MGGRRRKMATAAESEAQVGRPIISPNCHGERSDKKPRNNYLVVAGWIIILAGVLALVNGAGAIIGHDPLGLDFQFQLDRYSACGALVIAIGAVAIAGGISALAGKHVSLALAGAVCGVMGGGYFGFWLGLFALVLLFLSKEDL